MTIEDLEKYRGTISEMKALELEIDALYDVRKSPTGHEGTGSTGPGDPTGRNAMRIIELKEKLLTQQEKWSDTALTIESWLATVEDPEIRSIVRWHYILGLSWKRTSAKVYGRGDYYIARKRIYRFFGKE
jgi:hypothetical protein